MPSGRMFFWFLKAVFVLFYGDLLVQGQISDVDFSKYEFKHSLKPFSFGSPSRFWRLYGAAQLKDNLFRLTSASRNEKGALWNKYPISFQRWQVLVDFQISGDATLGADGMAFWYTETPLKLGPVYGGMDQWKGLAVVLDTYNNDQWGHESHIIGVLNDGTKKYHEADDGLRQSFGRCDYSLRNLVKPLRLRITYKDGHLKVEVDPTHTGGFALCFEKEVNLLQNGFFGVSAATGDLFDNHDLLALRTFNLDVRGKEDQNDNEKVLKQHEDTREIYQTFADENSGLYEVFQNQLSILRSLSKTHANILRNLDGKDADGSFNELTNDIEKTILRYRTGFTDSSVWEEVDNLANQCRENIEDQEKKLHQLSAQMDV